MLRERDTPRELLRLPEMELPAAQLVATAVAMAPKHQHSMWPTPASTELDRVVRPLDRSWLHHRLSAGSAET